MTDDQELLWYASYASNLSRNRFLCYIKGGAPRGSTFANPGCTDSSDPLADTPLDLPFGLYFAGESQVWSGGIAFITHQTQPTPTKGRGYLITKGQFREIAAQESHRQPRPIDFPTLFSQSYLQLGADMYDRLLYCGDHQGHPVVTFTSPHDTQPYVQPVESYVRQIGAGLTETYGMTPQEVSRYLSIVPGIAKLESVQANELA